MVQIYAGKAPWTFLKGYVRDIRPIWLMEEMGVPYKRVSLDPKKGENKTPEFLMKNPFGKLPVLEDEGFCLFESSAIVTHLATKHGKLIPPMGTKERAVYDQWVAVGITNLEPQNFRVFGCDHMRDPGPATTEIRAAALDIVATYMKGLEPKFRRDDYVLGQSFSAADVLFTTSIAYLDACGELDRYPATRAYVRRMKSRPAYQKALAQNGE